MLQTLKLIFFSSLCRISYVLDGVPRMRERPIGDLVIGLKQLGADVDCINGTNCPPVRINGKGGLPGGKVLTIFHLSLLWAYMSYMLSSFDGFFIISSLYMCRCEVYFDLTNKHLPLCFCR